MGWYIGHTKPRQEDRVLSRLVDLGLKVFYPRIEVRRKRRGRGVFQIEPLFPDYLFIAAELTPQVWNLIRWTPGMKTILGCDGLPSSISDEPIALIRQRVGADGVLHPTPTLLPGDRVRVTDGPFAGLLGILERPATRSGRVRVLLEMLCGASVELENLDLELAS